MIEVEDVQPPAGQVRAGGLAPVAFSGWLGLMRILERLIDSAELASQRLGDQLDA